MIKITDHRKCCGCSACASVCAHGAIAMVADDLGFLYPKVDETKCVDCGLCEKVCNFQEDYNRGNNYPEPLCYAVRSKDDTDLQKSQTGGAFFVLAKSVIEQGGVVYGAAFDGVRNVKHTRVTDLDGLELLRGSKYIQSNTDNAFRMVKDDLKAGKTVLYSGTSCQIAGLKNYIGHGPLSEHLFLVDIICHGVGAPAFWKGNIDYIEAKYNAQVTKANFRDKRFGWNVAKETYTLSDGRELTRRNFLDLYLDEYISRDCCAQCPYTNLKRVGDITVGDFWKWTDHHSEFNDNKGVSLLLVDSEKGKTLFEAAKPALAYIESNTPECLQPQLKCPPREHPRKSQLLQEYRTKGYTYVIRKYTNEGWRLKLKGLAYNILKKIGLK